MRSVEAGLGPGRKVSVGKLCTMIKLIGDRQEYFFQITGSDVEFLQQGIVFGKQSSQLCEQFRRRFSVQLVTVVADCAQTLLVGKDSWW